MHYPFSDHHTTHAYLVCVSSITTTFWMKSVALESLTLFQCYHWSCLIIPCYFQTWDEANQYCTERQGRLLRLETASVFSSLRYGIPYVSSVTPDTPAAWIGGYTTNFTILPSPPLTTASPITTVPSGNSTNDTTSIDVFNPFRLDPAAAWYWTNGPNTGKFRQSSFYQT